MPSRLLLFLTCPGGGRRRGRRVRMQAFKPAGALSFKILCLLWNLQEAQGGENHQDPTVYWSVQFKDIPRSSDRFWAACHTVLLQWISLTALTDGWFSPGPLCQQLWIHHLVAEGNVKQLTMLITVQYGIVKRTETHAAGMVWFLHPQCTLPPVTWRLQLQPETP